MIEVEGLTKYYGNYHALKGVTFSVAKGEILGFLGPNGAGKTTTMRILTCFFPATSGKARVAGFDVFEEPLEVRKRIGYVPENVPLYKDITVEDYLEFAAGIKGVGRRDVKNAVTKVMDECVLTDVAYKFIGNICQHTFIHHLCYSILYISPANSFYACCKFKVILNRDILVKRDILRHIAYPLPYLQGFLKHIKACNPCLAACCRKEAGEYAHCGGFSCAVRPEEAKDLPLCY